MAPPPSAGLPRPDLTDPLAGALAGLRVAPPLRPPSPLPEDALARTALAEHRLQLLTLQAAEVVAQLVPVAEMAAKSMAAADQALATAKAAALAARAVVRPRLQIKAPPAAALGG